MSATVLVVDDETDIRQAVAEILADEGYEVCSASDGAEALVALRKFHPSLVLLDLMMPRMNGWEFRAAQKRDAELAGIPVVVLSAVGRPGTIDADGFIQKPFDLEELLGAVKRHARAA